MANIDWVLIQQHLKNDTLRDHFSSMFTSQTGLDAYVGYSQYFLSKFSQNSLELPEISVSLPILRIFLLCVPNYVFRGLQCNSSLIDWLLAIISNDDDMSHTGTSLSILSILAKNITSLDATIADFAACFNLAIEKVSSIIDSKTSCDSLHLVITVHQLEDLLNCIGSFPSLPANVISKSLGDSAKLIEFLLSDKVKEVKNGSKLVVDSVKLCAMILEVWVAYYRSIDTATQVEWNQYALTILQNLFTLTVNGDLLHDSFHTAINGAVEMLLIVSHSVGTIAVDAPEAFEIRRNVLKQCCYFLKDIEEGLTSVIECGKVEAIIGYIACFFETDSTLLQDKLSADVTPCVPDVVDSILKLQQKMKEKMSTNKSKELKGLYSDIRKGSIATMGSVLGCCPQWIIDNQNTYWEVCLKSLMTPVLFTVGYKALSQDSSFLNRMLQYLHTSLLAIPRYSSAAADDIIQTLQDLIDSGHCTQLYANTTSYDILTALVASYSLSPKPSSDSNATDTKLNWQISVVVSINALLQLCKSQYGTNSLSEEFFQLYYSKFVSEFISLTSNESSTAMNSKGKAADLKVELLHSITMLLMSLTEVCTLQYIDTVYPSLVKLFIHLMSISSRDIVFEDDQAQVSSELDLMTKIVILLNSPAKNDGAVQVSGHSHCIIIAIVSLCNLICVRNGQEPEVDLSHCYAALVGNDKGVTAARELFEQLRCTYASSLSSQVQQKTLPIDSDIMYECTREAILNLTHHCTTTCPSRSDREQVIESTLQSVYNSLPLEVNQSSGDAAHKNKLKLKKTFVYDILCLIKNILEQ